MGNLLCLYLIFRSPQVQTWIVSRTTAYLSKELNTKISITGVNLTWFFDLVLEDILIEDTHHKVLLKSSELKIDIDKINIRNKKISFKTIGINSAEINLVKYKSDTTFNYSFIANYFSGTPDTAGPTKPWQVKLNGLKLKNCVLLYSNQHKELNTKSMDYDHLLISVFDFNASNINYAGDSINLNIANISAKEKSGFTLTHFKSVITLKSNSIIAHNLHIISGESDINTDLKFSFRSYNSFNDFIDSVSFISDFKPSILNLNELRYFSSSITGMEDEINFNGLVKGTVSSLKARGFHFSFGNVSDFNGEINMDGLPDIEETFIHLKVKKLSTDYYDIANIKLPGSQVLNIPPEIKNIGTVDIKGFFTGFIYDFVSSADFYTSIGTLETDLSLQTGRGKILKYSGQFNLKEWNLGKTLSLSEKVGAISMTSTINGEILNKKHNNLTLIALIEKVELLKNEFNDISVNGQLNNRLFNGNLKMHDELADLDFKGMVDLTNKIPVVNCTAILKNAYLAQLNLWDHDLSSKISTRMDLNFTGSNIDNLLGYLSFDSTVYFEKDKSYYIKNIELSTQEISHDTKKLSLKSDLLDASFYGMFSFKDFYNSLSNIVSLYLPSLNLVNQKQTVSKEQLFDYSFQLKNIKPLTEIFLPEFDLTSEASLYGSYNSQNNTIIFNGLANSFIYKGMKFKDWYVRSKNAGSSLQLASGISSISFVNNNDDSEASPAVENLIFKTFMQGDSIKYDLNWDDEIVENYNIGHINGYFSFADFPRIHTRFENFELKINNKPWVAKQNNDIIIDSTAIEIQDVEIAGANQKLKLAGKISKKPEDILKLNFTELDISNIDRLINVKNVDFDGILTGSLSLKDLYNTQQVEAQVEVKDFAFNKERMGDANIKSVWNHDISALDLQVDVIYKGNVGTHIPISAKGLIYTSKRPEGNFDMDVKVMNYKLASLNPFLRGIASNIKGFASGNLKLTGTFEKPQIVGELDLLRTQMKIDYLNVTYSFANKVIIEPKLISANNVTIYDSLGNTGTMNFNLRHENFRNIKMNIDIAANKMNSLNTTFKNNNLFYGKAFGTGTVKISGSFKQVDIKIDAKSEPNTSVYIPINLAVGASENNFIKFKSKDSISDNQQEIYYTSESGTDVTINLQVNENAEMQLFLPENIGNIKGTGRGNVQIGINKQGEFTMYGDYVMDQGSFLFTLGNVINRVFSIENGSKISFNGSPYDADIDLSAIYKLRASMKGLPEQYAGKAVPVDCIIRLKNDLYNPDISFSIRLPENNNELNQIIFAAIDTTNQVVMTQQIVSLLVLKTFALNSSPTFGTSVGSSSIEVLTDQLSNMLSQISDNVDIGVKYRTGDELTNEELEVALSTNLFNDRVSIDGNVGMYTTGSTQNTNSIVGDVTVDVKITPDGRLRVKAFNKSNPFDITPSSTNSYKQGIGVYYRYEFDKFSDIFRRKKKKS